MNYMNQFRELYYQRGAGGHFLASKCLWNGYSEDKLNKNEYHAPMYKTIKSDGTFDATGPIALNPFLEKEFRNIKTETKKVLSVIESSMNEPVTGIKERNRIFLELKKFYDNGCNDFLTLIDGLFNGVKSFKYLEQPRPSEWEVIEEYFRHCKNNWYRTFETNNWSLHSITHEHPHSFVSSKLNTPHNMKTMAFEVDSVTDVYVRLLADMKGGILEEPSYYEKSQEKYTNMSARLSDETVSYRKVFFDNDENEIKRLYAFFNNLGYFEENKTDIIRDFKEYHTANIQTLESQSVFVPKVVHALF
tara:strand:- start:1059 stop:1970 length:912 start_codon:yes stop_codon:yes gene_type:complete